MAQLGELEDYDSGNIQKWTQPKNEVSFEEGVKKARDHMDKLEDRSPFDKDDLDGELRQLKNLSRNGGKFYFTYGGHQYRYGSASAFFVFIS